MIFFITDGKKLSQGQLLSKIRAAALSGVDYIMLRENHLSDESYLALASSVQQIVDQTHTDLVVCHRPKIAEILGVHLHSRFHERLDVSFSVATHSKEEMQVIDQATYCLYGHVFESACKEGLAPRGYHELSGHKKAVALGGINLSRAKELMGKAKHLAFMSAWQESEDIRHFIDVLRPMGY